MNLRTAAFPKLAPEEIAMVARCAEARLQRYRDGEALIRAGDRESKFFVVVSGELAVLDEAGDQPRTIAVLGPGEFTGEVTGLMGAASLVTIVARGACEVYSIDATSLREIINRPRSAIGSFKRSSHGASSSANRRASPAPG